MLLAAFFGQAFGQGVSEIRTLKSGRSAIISISVLNFSNVALAGEMNDQVLDQGQTGLGFATELNLNQRFGVEIGVFNMKRRYALEEGGSKLIEETKRIHIPVLLRGWLADYLSLGFGPYAAVRSDDIRSVSTGEIGEELETGAKEDVETGWEAALALNVAFTNKTGFFLEGRFSEPMPKKKMLKSINSPLLRVSGLT